MNLDDLMEVWRSQDAAPLHGVNETLLRLALREDEAKLEKERRRNQTVMYVMSAFLFAMAIFFLAIMIYPNEVITGWDLIVPAVGAAVALFMAGALYFGHRAQVRREQHFGDSLRDQLGRRIEQLDYEATRAVRLTSTLLIAMLIVVTAILFATMRVNSEPGLPFDQWPTMLGSALVCWLSVVLGIWEARRQAQRNVLPRKQRLEALLKELDGQ